jgi:parallel beta-helix repeat protein
LSVLNIKNIFNKKTFLLFFLSGFLIFQANHAQAYNPPIGIPEPTLGSVLGNGIDIEHPQNPPQWPNAEAIGYYYIDNSSGASCTNSGNIYGYPAHPRCAIPTILAAGSVVEIHEGNYTGDLAVTFNGTETSPIFFYGVGAAQLTGGVSNVDLKFEFSGSYFVIDNLDVVHGRFSCGPSTNAIIKNCNIDGAGTDWQGGLGLGGTNLISYNNNIHHHQGNDKHGIGVGEESSNIWILNNYLHHNGGDGVQFCHGCSAHPPHHIYIGFNDSYSNRENAFDFKYGRYVVLSQNICRKHVPSYPDVEFCFDDGSLCTINTSGSDGAAIVVGSDGDTEDIWVINNKVYDNTNGIRVEAAANAVIIGNLIYNNFGNGIEIEKYRPYPITIAYNTIYGANIGLKGPWQAGHLVTHINNNIFAVCSDHWIKYLQNESATLANIDNNLFHNSSGNGTISISPSLNVVHFVGSTIDSQTSGIGNVVGNPQFINIGTDNYNVGSTSSAINVGSSQLSVYNSEFQAIFGSSVSILYDFIKTVRPQGSAWDIGAYEYDESTPPDTTAPNSPTNLSVL